MIGEVHAGGAHCDAHLTGRGRRWIGTVLHLEDRGGTVLGDDDCAHVAHFPGGAKNSNAMPSGSRKLNPEP